MSTREVVSSNPINALRRRLGLSKMDFARLLGVSLASVYRWEGGDHNKVEYSTARLLPCLRRYADIPEAASLTEVIATQGEVIALYVMLKATVDVG